MAVIPPNAGLQMRTQTDPGQVQHLASVRGIPSDLPEFQAGQVFSARILDILPDATYKALVAGRQITLQLPEGATPGDVLQLKVVDRSAHAVIARRTEGEAATQAEARPYPYTRISDAGHLISQLLPPEGETPAPAALNRGQPLAAQPPTTGAQLASALQTAVSESGLFYEAHQAQWVAGERSLASLRTEPQGQLPSSQRTESSGPSPNATVGAQHAADSVRGETTGSRLADLAGARTDSQAQAASGASATQGAAPTVPDAIRNIVQQQLDAAATQRLAWHGEVWPGQPMEWAIQRDTVEERESGSAEDVAEAPRWSTSLRLTMPRLGTVDAVLQLTGNGLRVRVAADDKTAANLRSEMASLAAAMGNAGLQLQALEIRHEE